MSRVRFLALAGLTLALSGQAALAARPAVHPVVIRMVMTPDGSEVYFDPAGVHIQPGQTVRWVQVENYHSVTSYHPSCCGEKS